MNVEAPDLKQLSAEALRDLLNNLTQAKGFILEQAPEFCQQLVMRGMWMPAFSSLLCVIGILAICVLSVVIILAHSKGKIDSDDASIAHIPLVIAAIFLIFGAVSNAYSALSVYIAPKVFLVEEITRMIR